MKIFKDKKYTFFSKLLKGGLIFVFAFSVFLPGVIVYSDQTVQTKIENPLGENGPQDIPDFIDRAIDIVLVVGVPIVVLAIIYSGFLFVSAQGNSEKLKKAKQAILYSIIGAVLLLGAFVIANAISDTVKDIEKGS